MKLTSTLAALALAGAFTLTSTTAQAAIKLDTAVTFKLTAVIQKLVDDETADGSVSTTEKATIVNKDILDAYEEWAEVTLPDGANIGMDEDYFLVILDRDGDVLYDAEDLQGFLEYEWDVITEDGRSKEKDNGDYTNKYVQRATTEFLLFGTFVEDEGTRNAVLDVDDDFADLLGVATFEYTETFNADRSDLKYKEKDNFQISGSGTIEDSDAIVSGEVKMKYNLLDDDYTPEPPLLGGAAARSSSSTHR